MTPDEYVLSVLTKYAVARGPQSRAERAANGVAPSIREWAGEWLANLALSGSYAKGTAVRGGSDIDLFISLKSDTPGTLAEIYDSLFQRASRSGWLPRRQTVSIGINFDGVAIDLVPARIQAGYLNWHSLYKTKTNSWTQTNVNLHVKTIAESRRTDEIRAIKIWRNLRTLDFHSFYLELTVIDALRGRQSNCLADNVLVALHYIADYLMTSRVEDPANTNNCISADLSLVEKQRIALAARASTLAVNWGKIIW